jgi:hypothetical protein
MAGTTTTSPSLVQLGRHVTNLGQRDQALIGRILWVTTTWKRVRACRGR